MNPSLQIIQSLTTIVLTVSGTDGKDWQVIVDDSWSHSGSGDAIFNTSLFGAGYHQASLIIAGFVVANASYIETTVTYPPPTPPAPPAPPPKLPDLGSGEERLQAIGTSCHLIHKFGGSFDKYLYESDVTGERSTQYDEWGTAVYYGAIDPRCQQAPPEPAPTYEELEERVLALESSLDGLNAHLEIHQSIISDIITAAETESKAWRSGLESAVTGLKDWILKLISDAIKNITAVTDILVFQVSDIFMVQLPKIWISLEDILTAAETESKAWRSAYDSIWEKLEDWLIERILVIIEKALDREVRSR